MDPLEILWDALLSREPERIRAAFAGLDAGGQADVLAHLKRMASEEGWHAEQRASSLAALTAIGQEAPAGRGSRRKSHRHK